VDLHDKGLDRGLSMLERIEDNNLNGSYALAALAALFGAIIGAVPAFIVFYFFGSFIAVLFAIIPMGCAFAYRRARGVENKFMPIIVTIWSLVASVLLIMVDFYVSIFGWYWGLITLDGVTAVSPLSILFELILSDIEFFMLDIMMALAFCGLGIFTSWGYIALTNKAKIKKLQDQQEADEAARCEKISH